MPLVLPCCSELRAAPSLSPSLVARSFCRDWTASTLCSRATASSTLKAAEEEGTEENSAAWLLQTDSAGKPPGEARRILEGQRPQSLAAAQPLMQVLLQLLPPSRQDPLGATRHVRRPTATTGG